MKALVTGGGGFLGSAMVRILHERGDQVAALGRGDYPHLQRIGVQTIRADICDPVALGQAFRGIDVVFHAAALAGIWGLKRDFWRINYRGTVNVIEACRAAGVDRLIYTSTPSVVFGEGELCGVDESQPYPSRFLAEYPASKAEAEQAVLAANDGKLATVALRPHLIWGPGDPHIVPRIVDRARAGKLVQVGDGMNLVDIIYIDNAAEAHVLAADALADSATCAGKPYFISQDEPVSLWPWINDLLTRLHVRPVRRSISHASARVAGGMMEWIYGLLAIKREPRMTRFLAAQLAKSHYFDITAAKRDFGYQPRISTEEGLKRLVASMQGVLNESKPNRPEV